MCEEGETGKEISKDAAKGKTDHEITETEHPSTNIEEKETEESKLQETDDESSPRGVLEIPVSGSDSDHSSIDRSSSFGSEKSMLETGVSWDMSYGTLHWKKLFGQMKKKTPMRFSSIPLIGGYGYDLSKKAFRRRLGRNHSATDAIDCGEFVVPKPSWRNFSYEELKLATNDFSPGKVQLFISISLSLMVSYFNLWLSSFLGSAACSVFFLSMLCFMTRLVFCVISYVGIR